MAFFAKSHHRFLYRFIKPYRARILLAGFVSFLLSVCATIIATLVGPSFRLLMEMDFAKRMSLHELFGERLEKLASLFFNSQEISVQTLFSTLPILLLAAAFIKLILGTSQYFMWEHISELMTRDLRQFLNDRFLAIPPHLRKTQQHRDREAQISTLITTDVKFIREFFVHFYGGLPRELMQIFLLGQTLILLSQKLFLIFFFGVVPGIAIINRLGRKLKKRAQHALKDYSQLTEWLQQRLLGVETIKHYGTENLESEKMLTLSEKMIEKFLRAARVKARTGPILEFVGILAMVCVLFVALNDIRNGTLHASVAVSFFTALALLTQSANIVARYLNSNREGAAAIARISEFLDELAEAEVEAGPSVVEYEQKPEVLRLQNIEASYPHNPQKALENFSFSFQPGKIYCLKGPSGAGKSTLFNIILANLNPSSGRVIFSNDVLNKGIGYLPQDLHVFYGSIAANVVYPETSIDYQRLENVLRSVGLWENVLKLPQSFETIIGGKGKDLSGGQIQRVHLARLLYHQYPLVLIDEGTSALDPENENLICDLLLKKVEQGSTIIMISHRTTPLEYADEILTLKEGKLLNEA